MPRVLCNRCLRPQSACFCEWITPVLPVFIEVLILQHPLEALQAKGSARLLHLSLANSRMVVGEVFEESVLTADAATSGWPGPTLNFLLYPALPSDIASQSLCKAEIDAVLSHHGARKPEVRLVVIDGTWRKSRKMLYLNAWLQRLPRLALQDIPASSYRIRKAHKPGQLSTLEATCAALAQLGGDDDKYAPVLRAFDGFVEQQMARRSEAGPAAQVFSRFNRPSQ